MCEGIKERTDDEEDDEEHTASYDSSDGESSQLQLLIHLLLQLVCHCFYLISSIDAFMLYQPHLHPCISWTQSHISITHIF